MKAALFCLCVGGVSLAGSLAVNHFPFNLLLTIPCAFYLGYHYDGE